MPSVERSEQIKIFREDYVSVAIYRNQKDDKTYYDLVPARLIWEHRRDGSKRRVWKRGANFKPEDLMKLIRLLIMAIELLNDYDAIENLSPTTLELIKLVAG